MAGSLKSHFLLLSLFFFFFTGLLPMASSTLFTLQNSCSYTVWPASLSRNDTAVLGGGGFALAPGDTVQIPAPEGWSGGLWARTGCTFNNAGRGRCSTGDCGGALRCTGGGAPPVSIVDFAIGSGGGAADSYDVSLVDGYNVGVSVQPSGGSGECRAAGCVADVNSECPEELRVVDGGGAVVACMSGCAAFGTAELCCTGDHAAAGACAATPYSEIFKSACPCAYSYAHDDVSNTCTCTASDYFITFCPST